MARPEKHRRITILDDLLVYEVLVRLPVKSLARFRCVCRSWRAGIADPAFVRRHRELSRAKPPSVLVIPREADFDVLATCGEISFHRLQPSRSTEAELLHEQKKGAAVVTRFIHPAHCDGLVAIATKTDRVFVCNPATREFVALPPGSHNAELDRDFELDEEYFDLRVPPVAIGFDRWRNSYVVARYFYRTFGEVLYDEATGAKLGHLDYDIGHEVFTLGAGGKWEVTQDPPHAVGTQRRPICTRRAFYWHADMPEPRLMRFGLRDRKFDVVPRPPAVGWTTMDEMTELDGKLCYVHATANASFQVWLADDEDALQWSLRCRIVDPFPGITYTIAPMIVDGDEMVVDIGHELCRYDVKKQAMVGAAVDLEFDLRYKRPDGSEYDCVGPNTFYYVVPYFDSLVSPRSCNY